MSRWIESENSYGRYYIESLADSNGCRWLINEVCCNVDCDMNGDFPLEGDCTVSACGHFEPESQDDIKRLQKGVRTNGHDV